MKKYMLPLFVFTLLQLTAAAQKKTAGKYGDGPDSIAPAGIIKNLTDDQLLETVQKQTFRFFWHGAHPYSGLALERSNTVLAEHYWDYINEAWDEPNFSKTTFGPDAGAIGGTGFGIMSTIVAVNRGWIGRDTAVRRLIKIADFLINADCYHGIYPHFMNGRTGKTIKFDRLDDGADIVETSYLLMGFLCAREYFNKETPREVYLRKRISQMWGAANWKWHTNNENKLYWHWSPNNGFDMNFPVWGYNECLITYIMSASSQYHSIPKAAYDGTWAGSFGFKNGKEYYGYNLPLGNYDKDKGGPLFFEQYTFQGIDPNGLKDSLDNDYFLQGKNHTLINRAYCMENPGKFKGYSDKCWGLTAGDSYKGYLAHSPENDRGVIQPTAAISSMPYTPKESMEALRYFYYEMGDKIWSKYGFTDGFSIHHNWYAKSHLAIDQGPIITMIENYRSGLLWKLFMNIPDVQNGLKKLGLTALTLNRESKLTKANKYWRYIENAAFVVAFFYISWDWVSNFCIYLYNTFLGKGMVSDISTQIKNHSYNETFMTIVWEVVFIITLWEISLLVYEGIKNAKETNGVFNKTKAVYQYVAKTFKPTFLSSFVGLFIPVLIKLDVFQMVTPFFNKFSLFIINHEWYSWVYAYLVWELSTWVWHYAFHRVRFFWCFHSPHHAPDDLTITTAWVHFFAEGYITTFLQWIILSVAGVPPEMLIPIFAIEVGWGTFIHAGERSLKKGRLGVLKNILITPSHHRVHHAKNPLYMDTNFCTFLPFWDWLFGTLQPLRDEVKIEYGITRKMDVTNFMDFYFGEFKLLFQDIKSTTGIKNKLLYLLKPPGWQPDSSAHTAAAVREEFLKQYPEMGITTRNYLWMKNRIAE